MRQVQTQLSMNNGGVGLYWKHKSYWLRQSELEENELIECAASHKKASSILSSNDSIN